MLKLFFFIYWIINLNYLYWCQQSCQKLQLDEQHLWLPPYSIHPKVFSNLGCFTFDKNKFCTCGYDLDRAVYRVISKMEILTPPLCLGGQNYWGQKYCGQKYCGHKSWGQKYWGAKSWGQIFGVSGHMSWVKCMEVKHLKIKCHRVLDQI